ncbi:MAG: PH domain-containing protein [Myxococcota bacterium]
MQEVKPVRTAFIIPQVTGAVVVALVSTVALVFAGLLVEPVAFALIPLAWGGLAAPMVYGAFVAYRKERYEIHDDHLVAHRGGLLSDARAELDIRNVTHVRLRLPWLRHYFFRIGDVRVESAGSTQSEITFRAIREPEVIYERIQQQMRGNGFSLGRSEVLHEESPGPVGALTDLVQSGIGVVTSIAFLGFGLLGLIGGITEAGNDVAALLASVIGLGFGVGTVILSLVGPIVRYLDLTRRTYTVYDDVVAYTEGFLTRDNAVIPFENIADANTNRTLIDQLLGLYDIKVSCQGSGSEVVFRRLSRGAELQSAIAALVARAGQTRREAVRARAADESTGATGAETRSRGRAPGPHAPVPAEDAWTATLQMQMARAQVPLLLLLPVFPAWVLAAVGMAVRAMYTTYTVGAHSMARTYAFIGASRQEFAYDKVTGVQVRKDPLDELFGTMTVQIWSIGAPQPLTLSHVVVDDVELPALLRQCGIATQSPPRGQLRQSVRPRVWIIQNLVLVGLVTMMALLVVGLAVAVDPLWLGALPVLAVVPAALALLASIRTDRQTVTFHDEHFEVQTGILFRHHTYVRYDDIKKVESVRIPFTNQGVFKVYVAGERVLQQTNGQSTGTSVPYSVSGLYIEDIATKVDAMDALMLGLIEPSQIEGTHAQDDDVISVSRPAFANEALVYALVSLVFPPLWLALPLVIWRITVRRYFVETDRVRFRSGILFESVVSILFNRIDSLQQNQGPLGKIFGNGNVTILTAGSSAPDLSVANVPDYQEVYRTVREHYGGGEAVPGGVRALPRRDG